MSSTEHEYERLADLELEAGASADTDEARTNHLNLAASFAHLSELHRRGFDVSVVKAELAACLKASLVVADKFGLAVVAIHINDAIISIDGEGVVSLEP